MKIKDGYISFINEQGREESQWYGGLEIINNKPKQIKFTKTQMLKDIKNLSKRGCVVRLAEICVYDVENHEYAECVDPIKRQYLV